MKRILSESKKDYIRTKIITLFQKMNMVIDDTEVILKNKIIESIYHGNIKLRGQSIKNIDD
jgi:small nuclear ribonucleoprotein (snRNP)-like protein